MTAGSDLRLAADSSSGNALSHEGFRLIRVRELRIGYDAKAGLATLKAPEFYLNKNTCLTRPLNVWTCKLYVLLISLTDVSKRPTFRTIFATSA